MRPVLDALRQAAPGQRWVLRVRQDDGSASDVIGFVVRTDATEVELALPFDPATEPGADPRAVLAYERVVVARRAPAAPGGPDPARVSAPELERRALPGWRAAYAALGDWTLRSGGGFTGRANSCLAVGDPGVPLAQAAERIVAYAAAHGIEPRAQVVLGSAEDEGLSALGWREAYVVTDVLVTRLAALLEDRSSAVDVRVDETLTPAWRAAYDRSRPWAGDPAVVTAVLDGGGPRAFGSVSADGRVEAVARGHLAGPWLGLAGIWTAEPYRRRGWATAMITGLGHWAARRGGRYAYLQVASANAPALAAYARLGFVLHHRYRYLAPAAP